MESVNFIRGYGKVNPSEDQTFQFQTPQKPIPKNKSNITTIISITIFLLVIIGAIIGVIIHSSNPSKNQETGQTQNPSASLVTKKSCEMLKIVCNVTQHQDLCFNSIYPIYELLNNPKPTPILFYNISLQVAITQIKNLSSLPESLMKQTNDPGTKSALTDCISLFDDSLTQFNNSFTQMNLSPGESKTLTEMKISNMQTWMSAALTDQETCLDGLREMSSRIVEDVEVRVHDTEMYMGISLAILNNLSWLVEKLGFVMN
ncbi:esterase [Lithospermum erythrorhizon]|uniref:pectinesterase n=1 Tax=Lithospermum erythrorhizon TaxID=34254 RepID=A0AAV3RYW2_LITER